MHGWEVDHGRHLSIVALHLSPPAQSDFDGPGVCGNRVWPVLAGAHPGSPVVGRLQRSLSFSVHRNDTAAGFSGRAAEPDRGKPDHDGDCSADRHAAGHTRWHLYGRIRSLRPADNGCALHQRHSVQRTSYRSRPIRVRGDGRTNGPFLGMGGSGSARRHRRARRGAHHRRHAHPGAGYIARSGGLDRAATFEHDHQSRLSSGACRHGHRRAARRCADLGGDRAAAVYGAQQPVLESQSECSGGEPARRHLPVCTQPLFRLAKARLDRRPHHHTRGACPEHHRTDPHGTEKDGMSVAAITVPTRTHAPSSAEDLVEKISIRNLDFFYGDHRALKSINVPLYQGKVTAFIGPSGCGKSTLLRILNRMYDLYPNQRATGHVRLDNDDILSPSQDLNLLRAKVGMVFQKPTPFPMTIFENIAFGIRLYERLPKAELEDRVKHALERAALWEEVKDKLGANGLSLSGGQQQRLCIARTVAVRPEVILFDEPCSALDPISTAKIEELIDELKDDYTIAIVTHNMQQAARVSDFTAFMYLGDLVEFGETTKIFTSPNDRRTQDYITGRFG